MLFFKRLTLSIGVLLIVFSATVSLATDCPAIVQAALSSVDQNCSTIGRNQVCYGNINLQVEPQADTPQFNFTKPGDLVNVDSIKTVTLSPLDQQAATWGVALMKIQANLPDTLPGQNVTFLLFGDVHIQTDVNGQSQAAQIELAHCRLIDEPKPVQAADTFMHGLRDGAAEFKLRCHTRSPSILRRRLPFVALAHRAPTATHRNQPSHVRQSH